VRDHLGIVVDSKVAIICCHPGTRYRRFDRHEKPGKMVPAEFLPGRFQFGKLRLIPCRLGSLGMAAVGRRVEYLVPALAIVSLLAACWLISQNKTFWADELLSYYLLSDDSFSHMLKAFHDKINNAPPLYFLLGWVWANAFGSTPLSLRLFSSVGMAVATLVTWFTLRRVYGFFSASIGALTVFCSSVLIAEQNAEARMYGLYLALSSVLVLQFQINNETKRTTSGLSASNACIHAALVLTHLFGLLYSGVFLLAQMVTDRSRGIFRTKLYAAIILSWLLLLLYLPSFFNQADIGSTRFWLSRPSVSDGFDLLMVTAPSIRILVLFFLLCGLAALFCPVHRSGAVESPDSQFDAERSLAIIGVSFLTVPVAVFVISWIRPLFLARYLIPTALIWSIFLAAIARRIMDPPNRVAKPRSLQEHSIGIVRTSALMLFLTACVLKPLFVAQGFSQEQLPGSSDARYGYENLPIVVEFSQDFVTRLYYSSQPGRYFFVLDWPSAVEDSSGLLPPGEYKGLEALRRQYPKTFENVVESDKFLETNNRFLVLTLRTEYDQKCPLKSGENFDCPRWVANRLAADSRYRLQSLGNIDGPGGRKQVLRLVEKIAK
jgi:hypothetical protein